MSSTCGGDKIGIGIHRHAPERDDSGDHHEARQHQHQEALTKRSLYDSMDHSGVDAIVLVTFIRSSSLATRLALQRVRKLQEQAAISDDAITGLQSSQ